MRLFFSLIALIFFNANSYEITVKVIHIVDGDTFDVIDSNHIKHRIRPAGIDAPERGQPFGKKSTQMLANLIKGKVVTNKCTGKDRYKRDICVVWLDNEDINRKMVELGGAWVYRKYYNGSDYYDAEKSARENHRGLWKTTEAKAVPPWQWRRGVTNDINAPAVKLSRNNICHAKGTKYYNRVKHYTQYSTIKDCLQTGRLPRG